MKTVRMQFDMTEDKALDVEKLMAESGITTKKELFNYALTILEWAIDENGRGNDIASIDREKKQVVSLKLPIFKRLHPIA